MKRLGLAVAFLLIMVAVAPQVAGQSGKVADDFIRLNVDPDFQYRSDKNVIVSFQAKAYRGGAPQDDLVRIHLTTADRSTPIELPNGQSWLNGGVSPYPSTHDVNFGKLEPGLYQMIMRGSAGGLTKEVTLEFAVALPPVPYTATLLGRGDEATFIFAAHEETDVFTIEMYRDGAGGRLTLERIETTGTELEVPYVPGEGVKISVTGPNGWVNSENKYTDFLSGTVSYPPYVWNPDFKHTANYQQQSWMEASVAGVFVVGAATVLLFAYRRKRAL